MNHNQKMDFEQRLFVTPPKGCNIVYGWAWNVTVTKEKIEKQLNEFVEAGIKGIYVLPLPKSFRPESLRNFMDPDYLTEEFFEMMQYTYRRAKELGMDLWIYDEGGWPSGGACMHTLRQNPEAAYKVLRKREVSVKAGEVYLLPEDTLAVYEGDVRIADTFTAEKDMELFEYFTKVWSGDRESHVDISNPGVTDTFIQNTYEEYKKHMGDLFSNGIHMMFTDEPQVIYEVIPKNGVELFREKFGYDLRDYLYVILDAEKAVTEKEQRARIDYLTLKGELFKKNYCQKLADWCRQNNVLFGGHFGGEDIAHYSTQCGYYSILSQLRELDVPGIDAIWEQIRYPYGGRPPVHYDYKDEMEEGCVFYPRVAPSAARQRGNLLALTETFGVYGDGVTPDEMRYILNYQAMRGINLFNIFTLSLGSERLSAFLERPVFKPEKPGFLQLAHFNRYFERVSYLGRLGEAEGDTALYYPAGDYCANKEYRNAAIVAYNQAGKELEEKNIPFDLIDDWGIMEAEDTGEGLKLGDAVYRHIVVPQNFFMPQDVKEKIAPYLGQGEPTLNMKSKALRVMTRKLENGRLYFFFNQLEGAVKEVISVPRKEKERLYRLDIFTGEMYETQDIDINLVCGDMAVYFVTEKAYDTVSDEEEYAVDVTDLVPVSVKRTLVTYKGLACEYLPGDIEIDADFSGEITYRGRYELPSAPKAGERYRVTLEDTSVSARISLNGEVVATVGCTPMYAVLPAEKLAQAGEIEVTVANTTANEILAKQHIMKDFPKAEIGPYAVKTVIFEERRPALKLGTVKIEKMMS